jgi:hypothetical protein
MDDIDTPFRMMGLFSMLAPMMAMLVFASLWGVVILYAIARWRHHRAGTSDPQLGLKFALHLFRFHGYHLLLAGGFALVYSVLLKGNSHERSSAYRAGFGFIAAGGLVYGLHTMVLQKSNQVRFPLVGRLFAGLNLIVTGMTGLVVIVIGFQMLFGKDSTGDAGRALWSMTLVYVTAWVVQGAMFGRDVLSDPGSDLPGSDQRGSDQSPPASSTPGATVPEPMRQPLSS